MLLKTFVESLASLRQVFIAGDRTLSHGTPLPPPSLILGCPRTLTTQITHDLYTLIEDAPDMFLDEIQDWLALAHDARLSKTTLFENICDAGISYKLLRKAAAERDT